MLYKTCCSWQQDFYAMQRGEGGTRGGGEGREYLIRDMNKKPKMVKKSVTPYFPVIYALNNTNYNQIIALKFLPGIKNATTLNKIRGL